MPAQDRAGRDQPMPLHGPRKEPTQRGEQRSIGPIEEEVSGSFAAAPRPRGAAQGVPRPSTSRIEPATTNPTGGRRSGKPGARTRHPIRPTASRPLGAGLLTPHTTRTSHGSPTRLPRPGRWRSRRMMPAITCHKGASGRPAVGFDGRCRPHRGVHPTGRVMRRGGNGCRHRWDSLVGTAAMTVRVPGAARGVLAAMF